MTVSKDAFYALCRKASVQNIPQNSLAPLMELAYKHISKPKWRHGKPVTFFIQDGYPCIRYMDGISFHYDLIKGKWF